MKLLATVFLAISLLSINACSRDYTPLPGSSGEKIFQEACSECHKADNKDAPGMIFSLDPANAHEGFIVQRVHTGSIKMPKFPNIKDNDLKQLSAYVLTHNLQR